VAIGTVGVFSILILLSINSDAIQNVLLSSTISGAIEASGRSELISRGLELFNASPLWGVGFGHYSYNGIFDTYPHNTIVELLAEIGIIGFSFIIILCCYVIFINRQVLLFLHRHNFKPYLVLLPLLVRAMISLNMTLNIIVFSFIFSLNCLNCIPQEGD
jgi:O-antigen ligase